jgi:hypothetical protein
MALERAGELADRPGEGQVEEQLKPARAPLIAVVTVGGPQCRAGQVPRVMAAPVTLRRAGRSSPCAGPV